jgi:hypothetical protein
MICENCEGRLERDDHGFIHCDENSECVHPIPKQTKKKSRFNNEMEMV